MKILVLSCSTGEGHNSAAKSIVEALDSLGVEHEFMDPIIFKSEKRMKFVASLYNKCISKMPWLFGIIYKAGQLYDLVLSYENADWKKMSSLAEELNIPHETISGTYCECVENVNETWNSLMTVGASE